MNSHATTEAIVFPSESSRDMLTPILRAGGQKMLTMAIEEEVQAWIDERAALRDAAGRRRWAAASEEGRWGR